MVASFLISVVLHHLYEKRYIVWKKAVIITAVAVLFLANVETLLTDGNGGRRSNKHQFPANVPNVDLLIAARNINTTVPNVTFNGYFYESDYVGNIVMGYENKTNGRPCQLKQQYPSL